MTHSPALALLTRAVATGGSHSIHAASRAGSGALSGMLAHPGILIVASVMVALGATCAAVLLLAAYTSQWLRRVTGRERPWKLMFGRRDTERAAYPLPEAESRSTLAGHRTLSAASTEQALRVLEGSSSAVVTSDHAWQARAEEVPGVGRVEWDAQTLRTFACQPEVLYRLAFHRWRLQQGKLSEFDILPVVAPGASGAETNDLAPRAEYPTRHVAPSSEEHGALRHGQRTTNEA